MNRGCLLTAGIVMILVAVWLAVQTPQPNRPNSAEVARQATAPQAAPSTPSATPRPTRSVTATLAPTVTPIPRWTKFQGKGFEVWLPEDYGGQLVDFSGNGGQTDADAGVIHRWLLLYGSTWKPNNFPATVRSVSIIERWADVPADAVPVAVPDLRSRYSRSDNHPVALGRYDGFQTRIAVTVSGTNVGKSVYWLKSDDVYWVVIYSAPQSEFEAQVSTFEKSISSFSILP